jgi:hypothetical protein
MMTPPEINPISVVLAKIRELQRAAPFKPFAVVTSSGKSYDIPTADHLTVMGLTRRIVIEFDDYSSAEVNPLHVSSVELRSRPGNRRKAR